MSAEVHSCASAKASRGKSRTIVAAKSRTKRTLIDPLEKSKRDACVFYSFALSKQC